MVQYRIWCRFNFAHVALTDEDRCRDTCVNLYHYVQLSVVHLRTLASRFLLLTRMSMESWGAVETCSLILTLQDDTKRLNYKTFKRHQSQRTRYSQLLGQKKSLLGISGLFLIKKLVNKTSKTTEWSCFIALINVFPPPYRIKINGQ